MDSKVDQVIRSPNLSQRLPLPGSDIEPKDLASPSVIVMATGCDQSNDHRIWDPPPFFCDYGQSHARFCVVKHDRPHICPLRFCDKQPGAAPKSTHCPSAFQWCSSPPRDTTVCWCVCSSKNRHFTRKNEGVPSFVCLKTGKPQVIASLHGNYYGLWQLYW